VLSVRSFARLLPNDIGLHLAHYEDEKTHHQQNGEPYKQQLRVPGVRVDQLGLYLDARIAEHLHHVRVFGRESLEFLSAFQFTGDILALLVSLDKYLGYVPGLHLLDEVGVYYLFLRFLRGRPQVIHEYHYEYQRSEQGQVLDVRVHLPSRCSSVCKYTTTLVIQTT